MTIKFAAVTVCLALMAGTTEAAPVSFDSGVLQGNVADGGKFSRVHQLLVGADGGFDFNLLTSSKDKADVSITSVVLSNGVTSFVFDSEPDSTSFISAVGGEIQTTEIKKNKVLPVTLYETDISFSPVFLTKGSWTITVNGVDANDKVAGSYKLTANDVPEPQTLALVMLGLAGVAAVARKRVVR